MSVMQLSLSQPSSCWEAWASSSSRICVVVIVSPVWLSRAWACTAWVTAFVISGPAPLSLMSMTSSRGFVFGGNKDFGADVVVAAGSIGVTGATAAAAG